MPKYCFPLLLLVVCFSSLNAQQDWQSRPWDAFWINCPDAPATEFGVVHFRRSFDLEQVPEELPVMVSADNRYQLYVNGTWIGEGPCRGDLLHWRYETFELAPYLRTGKNVIAAVVWNFGIDRPWAQQSLRTAFLLQPQLEDFAFLQTDDQWLSYHNPAYHPITDSRERLGTYIVVGPQLEVDGKLYPWGWESTDSYDDSDWPAAQTITRANPTGTGTEFYWNLVPRQLPPLERRELEAPLIVAHGVNNVAEADWQQQDFSPPKEQFGSRLIPAHSAQHFLLDYGHLTNAFFELELSGGKGSTIEVYYAESLVGADGLKGQRDATAGKEILGIYDRFLVGEGVSMERSIDQSAREEDLREYQTQTFSTLWFRTARFVELRIRTSDEPLYLQDWRTTEVSYPFEERASFQAPTDPDLTDIWNIGWRTARLCAQDTYVDCPYYEQLQYVGDTRIQALISLYVSGDDRLMRKAIEAYDQSRVSDGLTMSRYPTQNGQIIPPYSLYWVEMVGDYWWHRPDQAFVKNRLAGVRAVLDWFEPYLLENGLLGPMPYWNFVDWTPQWPWDPELRIGGVPQLEGGSSIISLQYLGALRTAIQLHEHFGETYHANRYRAIAERLATAVSGYCWDEQRGLLRDVAENDQAFSQHANILGLLEGVVPPEQGEAVLRKILEAEDITQASFYFRFYLMQLFFELERGELYYPQLNAWRALVEQGFSTFPETPDPATRSDCHAWSASPNYDLLATLAGIRPDAAGYTSVLVQPARVSSLSYTAETVHPEGMIRVVCQANRENRFTYTVNLPTGVSGRFRWQGENHPLQPGENKFDF
ncbi:MAG: alpha-L-rhamnosidase C-terminal domain-containing protein [Bacteroidota bacterium]